MPISTRFGDRRGSIAAVVTVLLLLAGGVLVARALTMAGPPPQPTGQQAAAPATAEPSATQPPPTQPPAPASSSPGKPAEPAPPDFGSLLPPSPPVALTIASIGVHTKGIVDLVLDGHGKLQAPTDFDKAGWYAAGPTPGELGVAVIGAHVDSKAGPAVFYRLGSLKKGAKVSVARKDGSTAVFTVDKVARYAKDDFPTATVYGDTKGRAELRLITCGGAFDQSTGHYVDNIVAFAHLVG